MARKTQLMLGLVAFLAWAPGFQRTPTQLDLPHGPVIRLASPDGSHILYGLAYQSGVDSSPQFWIEDTRTHQRKMLLAISGTLSAMWSPDGQAFSVGDHYASDGERTYIYDTDSLVRLDLPGNILAADPGAQRFIEAHAYFTPERWADAQHVVVRFHGHTDEAPITCFDFHYRVSRAGGVEKLSGTTRQPCR